MSAGLRWRTKGGGVLLNQLTVSCRHNEYFIIYNMKRPHNLDRKNFKDIGESPEVEEEKGRSARKFDAREGKIPLCKGKVKSVGKT